MKVLTANRLTDGEAVWFSPRRLWVERLADAEVVSDTASEARLEGAGKAALANNEVVDAELIDVTLANGDIVPVRLREKIRAAGPTNRTDLGKQARREVADSGYASGI